MDEIIKEGVIHRFENTHTLAWNVMKDYGIFQENSGIGGSRDPTSEVFQLHLVADGKVWMEMIGSQNKTSHTYNEETADEIYSKILTEYHPAFLAFMKTMEGKRSGEQGRLIQYGEFRFDKNGD